MTRMISMEDRQAQADARYAALSRLLTSSAIAAEDVCDLRRVFAEGWLERDEADMLFTLDAAPGTKCPGWTAFFVETITDHVVWQMRPTGTITDDQAEWLLAAADRAATLPAFALLINVLAEAHRVPLWLVTAIKTRARGWPGLDQALAAAVTAVGPKSAEAA
jgi:hypothetical protein